MIRRVLLFVKGHPYDCLAVAVVMGLAAHCLTLPYSPIRWGDEVMLNEMCRDGIGEKAADWSMVFFANETANHHAWAPYWFGTYWLEFGWKVFGSLGPRIATLCFLVMSLVAVCAYFQRLTGSKAFAAVLGLLYFSHPAVTYSVRAGRVETLAFFFLFVSLWFAARFKIAHKWGGGVIIAVFAVSMLFSWATAVVLLPIVFCEYLSLMRNDGEPLPKVAMRFVFFGIVCMAAVAVFLLPFIVSPIVDVHAIFSALRYNFIHGERPPASETIPMFVRSFSLMPLVYPLGVLLLLARRRTWLLALAAFFVMALFALSFSYVSRVVYILPYALLGIGFAYAAFKDCRRCRTMLVAVVLVMSFYSYARSIGVRTIAEFWARDYRDYGRAESICREELGTDISIYEDCYDLYYVGRELGWRQYKSAILMQRSEDEWESMLAALDHCDYYLCVGIEPKVEVAEALRDKGFAPYKTLLPSPDPERDGRWTTRFLVKHNRLSALGPYCVWRRKSLH